METQPKTVLPAIQDLYEDKVMVQQANDLNVLLNQPPRKDWIKIHPNIKGHQYIPVERVEYLLTRIFTRWYLEIKSTQLIANSVVVTVRLHVRDPLTGDMIWQDGVGAVPLQTDAGAGAIDFNKMKSSAVMIAAPAAESFAFKDAAEKFGKLFGKDLNRKDEVAYDNLLNIFSDKNRAEAKKKVEDLIQHCQDDDTRAEIVGKILDAEASRTDTEQFYKDLIDQLEGKK